LEDTWVSETRRDRKLRSDQPGRPIVEQFEGMKTEAVIGRRGAVKTDVVLIALEFVEVVELVFGFVEIVDLAQVEDFELAQLTLLPFFEQAVEQLEQTESRQVETELQVEEGVQLFVARNGPQRAG